MSEIVPLEVHWYRIVYLTIVFFFLSFDRRKYWYIPRVILHVLEVLGMKASGLGPRMEVVETFQKEKK